MSSMNSVLDRVSDFPYCQLSRMDELDVLTMDAPWGKTVIALQGAQLLSYTPTGDTDLLWLSPQAAFKTGKAIRGGIPVCWPWFGAHPQSSGQPAHGIARTAVWACTGMEMHDDHAVISWVLPASANTPEYPGTLGLKMTLGDDILLSVTITHHGDMPCQYGLALHSYFPVTDVEKTVITGLADKPYYDKPTGTLQTQRGDVRLKDEVDRVYKQVDGAYEIVDPVNGNIRISSSGFKNAIVWNPGQALASKMQDIGEMAWQTMVCVESGNVMEDTILLLPGEVFNGALRIGRK
ncbi:D-hexose-6-phosphate mutarotase [Leeia oryzae]|uniref:D-hexose-6-phosphate mutarotase n=1 Tax=Leeia oryzae TaxID=356662 RepID=UPI000476BFB6|nr:D-hexose-6-phosphate mutarotase [Leeia oryzae]